jgi:uncharacterized protein (DUF2336 family)
VSFQLEANAMRLSPEKLAGDEAIRSEVDLVLELPAICAIANEFMAIERLPKSQAAVCDEILLRMVRWIGPALRSELSERLAHLDAGPRLTVRNFAYDETPSVAVAVLRYSPLLCEEDVVKVARLGSAGRRSGAHLAAIAQRGDLSARTMDVLARSPAQRSRGPFSEDVARSPSPRAYRGRLSDYGSSGLKVGCKASGEQWCA